MNGDQASSTTTETANLSSSAGSGTGPGTSAGDSVAAKIADPCAPSQDGEEPGAQLRRLRDCLEDAQRTQKARESDVQRFTAQVAALSSLVDELEKVVADYAKAYDEKSKTQKAFADFKTSTTSGLEKLLDQHTRDQIIAAAAPLKKEISDLQDKDGNGKIKDEQDDLAEKKAELASAIAKRDAAKANFEKWKKAVASIGSRHAELKSSQDQIEKAADSGEPAFAWWLISDEDNFTSKLNGPVPVADVTTFRKQLLQYWNDFNAAIKDVQDLDGQVKGSEEALKSMKARLDDASKNLQARVRTLLSTVPITPSAGAPPANGGARGAGSSNPGTEALNHA